MEEQQEDVPAFIDSEEFDEPDEPPSAVAPVWHTVVFVAAVIALSIHSAHRLEDSNAPINRLVLYATMAAGQLAMLGWVIFGLWLRKVPLRSITGTMRWNPRAVAIDLGVASIFWICSLMVLGSFGLMWGKVSDQIAHHSAQMAEANQTAQQRVAQSSSQSSAQPSSPSTESDSSKTEDPAEQANTEADATEAPSTESTSTEHAPVQPAPPIPSSTNHSSTPSATDQHPLSHSHAKLKAKLRPALNSAVSAEQRETLETLVRLSPVSMGEIVGWILLSLLAGTCEEIIFRGYLQSQFFALTRGGIIAAVLLTAFTFGAGHAYQGIRGMFLIGIFSVLFSLLALVRGNLRAGMFAHSWHDLLTGLAVTLLHAHRIF